MRLSPPVPGMARSITLPWPLPAVLCWAAGLGAWWLALAAGLVPWVAGLAGLLVSGLPALLCRGPWRRLMAAAGFPLALLAWPGAAGALPALAWGVAAGLLLLLYPLGAWRDAPWFPTPQGALAGLAQACAAHPPLAVLDAGCGLGHGLRALHQQFPTARVHGVEHSRVLRWLAAWRCPWAQVEQGDLWAGNWAGYGLVYLFQRPESMCRAYDKALRELPPGAWLASLEFEVPGVVATHRLPGAQGRPVWLYLTPSTTTPSGR